MRIGNILLLGGGGLLLSACAVLEQTELPQATVPLLPAWEADALAGEVPLLGLEVLGVADEALRNVLEEALRDNLDLSALYHRMEASRQLWRISEGARWPSVQAEGAGNRQKSASVLGPEGQRGSLYSTNFSLGVSASWELDLWGRLSSAASGRLAEWEALRYDYQAGRLALTAEIARTWYRALASQRVLAVLQRTVENYQLNLQTVESAFDEGLRPALDVYLLRAQLAGAQLSLAQEQRALAEWKRLLNQLRGAYPAAQLALPQSWPSAQLDIPAGIPAEVLSRRPDMRAQERRLQAAYFDVEVARKQFFPQLALTVSGGTASDELSDLLRRDFSVWGLAGSLVQPLFEGGQLRANWQAEQAQLQAVVADYGALALQALAEVENALAAQMWLAQQQRAAQQAEAALAEAEEIAWRNYGEGTLAVTDVLSTQRQAFDAQVQLIQIDLLAMENRIVLYASLGGGLEEEENEQG